MDTAGGLCGRRCVCMDEIECCVLRDGRVFLGFVGWVDEDAVTISW